MRFGTGSGGYTHTSSPNGYGYTLTETKKVSLYTARDTRSADYYITNTVSKLSRNMRAGRRTLGLERGLSHSIRARCSLSHCSHRQSSLARSTVCSSPLASFRVRTLPVALCDTMRCVPPPCAGSISIRSGSLSSIGVSISHKS